MLPNNMNLRIGKVKNYNNKILISSPNFKVRTNLKINLDLKSKEVEMVITEPNVKPKVKTKPNIELNKDKEHKPITDSSREYNSDIEFDKEHKQDVKRLDTNKITYEEKRLL